VRFSNYMHEWLYGEEGYYTIFRDIGKKGDFYTAVSSSRFFGAAIAEGIFKEIKAEKISRNVSLIEIGAHKGYLLADMIEWLYGRDKNLIDTMNFGILERMPQIQKIQKEYLKNRLGNLKIEFFSSLEEIKKESIVFISNEIFDAFECELYKDGKIALVENHKIYWEKAPKEILEFAKKYSLRTGEISAGFEEFAKKIATTAKKIKFISFDYGEKYVRNDFSIRIYKSHQTYPLFDDEVELGNFYKNSDITYDVNFAHLIESFEKANFNLREYSTQARALVNFGIIEILEEFYKLVPYEKYLREADKVKTLLAPTIMGDKFKMVYFEK